jgi:hypothetical protein
MACGLVIGLRVKRYISRKVISAIRGNGNNRIGNPYQALLNLKIKIQQATTDGHILRVVTKPNKNLSAVVYYALGNPNEHGICETFIVHKEMVFYSQEYRDDEIATKEERRGKWAAIILKAHKELMQMEVVAPQISTPGDANLSHIVPIDSDFLQKLLGAHIGKIMKVRETAQLYGKRLSPNSMVWKCCHSTLRC